MKTTQRGEYYQVTGLTNRELLAMKESIEHRNGSLRTVGKDEEQELLDLVEQINDCLEGLTVEE